MPQQKLAAFLPSQPRRFCQAVKMPHVAVHHSQGSPVFARGQHMHQGARALGLAQRFHAKSGGHLAANGAELHTPTPGELQDSGKRLGRVVAVRRDIF